MRLALLGLTMVVACAAAWFLVASVGGETQERPRKRGGGTVENSQVNPGRGPSLAVPSTRPEVSRIGADAPVYEAVGVGGPPEGLAPILATAPPPDPNVPDGPPRDSAQALSPDVTLENR